MKRPLKKLTIIAVIVVMALGVFGLTGCGQKASKYTEAEHIQRIAERVEQRFQDEKEFDIYPLFDRDDKLTHFVVEFESGRFEFIMLFDTPAFSCTGSPKSMYRLGTINEYPWRRYTYDKKMAGVAPGAEESKVFDGTFRYSSPYKEANIQDEKRYLLGGGITAIKLDEGFFNLVSMNPEIDGELQPSLGIDFPYSQEFDL